jgi:thioredoxin 1
MIETEEKTMATITFTKDNFDAEVLKSDKPVLVDFWAPWCGPCRMVGPIVDEIAKEATHAKVGKVNVDEQEELAMKYGIMSIPTLIVFKNGQIDKQVVGGRSKADLLALLN